MEDLKSKVWKCLYNSDFRPDMGIKLDEDFLVADTGAMLIVKATFRASMNIPPPTYLVIHKESSNELSTKYIQEIPKFEANEIKKLYTKGEISNDLS